MTPTPAKPRDYIHPALTIQKGSQARSCIAMDCWCEIIAITIFGYWVLCRCLRWKRAAYIANKFQGREPYSLSVDEAQWIVLQFFQYEMPLPSRFSTAFALFRTYGIDSIAKTLIK
jgi:hypothetical protein